MTSDGATAAARTSAAVSNPRAPLAWRVTSSTFAARMSGPHGDLERVRAAIRGDTEGIQWVAERLRIVPRFVAHMARRAGGFTAHDVEDAAGEATQVALAGLRRYHGLAPFVSWLHRICINTIRGFARRRRLRVSESIDLDFADRGPDPSAEAALRDGAATLHRHIDAIGGTEAEVLRMRYLEGLDFTAIAARLDVPLATIRTRHYRALKKLQHRVAPRDDSEEQSP